MIGGTMLFFVSIILSMIISATVNKCKNNNVETILLCTNAAAILCSILDLAILAWMAIAASIFELIIFSCK